MGLGDRGPKMPHQNGAEKNGFLPTYFYTYMKKHS